MIHTTCSTKDHVNAKHVVPNHHASGQMFGLHLPPLWTAQQLTARNTAEAKVLHHKTLRWMQRCFEKEAHTHKHTQPDKHTHKHTNRYTHMNTDRDATHASIHLTYTKTHNNNSVQGVHFPAKCSGGRGWACREDKNCLHRWCTLMYFSFDY